jgi:hypothetical protein
MTKALRVLILPGWQSSGPGHWQSRWEALYGFERVEQSDWNWPRRGDWMARLDEAVLAEGLRAPRAPAAGAVAGAAAGSGDRRPVSGLAPLHPAVGPTAPLQTPPAPPRLVALVAHSLGCLLVAAWAAQSQHTARVKGALLVAPPDTARADMPPQMAGWRPIARARLPFPAVVVYSEDDSFCSAERALGLAADWGAEAVSLGAAGHINADSGLGDWPAGLDWLRRAAS